MSQEFLLKTPTAPASAKLDNANVAKQANKPETKNESSFSSALDKQVEQGDAPKKEPIEQAEASENTSSDKAEGKSADNEEDGNSLPENILAGNDPAETMQQSTDLIDADLDVAMSSGLKGEATTSSAKRVTTEHMLVAKVITSEDVTSESRHKNTSSIILGSDTILSAKGGSVEGLELDKKQQITSLRSDIFYALSKNKSAELATLDKLVTKDQTQQLTDRTERPDRSSASFSTATSLSGVSAAQASSIAQPILAVQPAIQSEAWSRVMSSRVVWMAREGVQEASLRLNPANLGSIEVKLTMHNEQANVLFIAQNAATRDALEQALPRLRESFEENGMQLADAEVADQEFEQAEDEHAAGEGIHQGNEPQSQTEIENEQATEIPEQELEVGLSLYA